MVGFIGDCSYVRQEDVSTLHRQTIDYTLLNIVTEYIRWTISTL